MRYKDRWWISGDSLNVTGRMGRPMPPVAWKDVNTNLKIAIKKLKEFVEERCRCE